MAALDTLSIRGIRSFSDEDAELIAFAKPLTVIVGQNGCGKTTIIECLKYATTGDLPPGASSGQSFVHDPKLAGKSEVKAEVKLKFKNRIPQTMVVVRHFQLTQVKAKTTFKALDSVLLSYQVNPTTGVREKRSIGHKCTDMDRLMPELLGVPKAVLEHVVFCHQEESNWPLMEGASLKKRFDDIFDSARYTKALVDIKSVRKDKMEGLREARTAATLVAAEVARVQSLRREDEEKAASIGALAREREGVVGAEAEADVHIAAVEQQVAANEEKLREVDRLRAQVDVTRKVAAELEGEMGRWRGVEAEEGDRLRGLSHAEVEGEDNAAAAALARCGDAATRRQERVSAIRSRLAALEEELSAWSGSEVRVQATQQLVDAAKREFMAAARDGVAALCDKGLVAPVAPSAYDDATVTTFLSRLQDRHRVEVEEWGTVQARGAAEVARCKAGLDDCASTAAELERKLGEAATSLRHLGEEQARDEVTLARLRGQRAAVAGGLEVDVAAAVAQLSDRIDELRHEARTFADGVGLNAMAAQVEAEQRLVGVYTSLLAVLQRHEGDSNKVATLREAAVAAEAEAASMAEEHAVALEHLLGGTHATAQVPSQFSASFEQVRRVADAAQASATAAKVELDAITRQVDKLASEVAACQGRVWGAYRTLEASERVLRSGAAVPCLMLAHSAACVPTVGVPAWACGGSGGDGKGEVPQAQLDMVVSVDVASTALATLRETLAAGKKRVATAQNTLSIADLMAKELDAEMAAHVDAAGLVAAGYRCPCCNRQFASGEELMETHAHVRGKVDRRRDAKLEEAEREVAEVQVKVEELTRVLPLLTTFHGDRLSLATALAHQSRVNAAYMAQEAVARRAEGDAMAARQAVAAHDDLVRPVDRIAAKLAEAARAKEAADALERRVMEEVGWKVEVERAVAAGVAHPPTSAAECQRRLTHTSATVADLQTRLVSLRARQQELDSQLASVTLERERAVAKAEQVASVQRAMGEVADSMQRRGREMQAVMDMRAKVEGDLQLVDVSRKRAALEEATRLHVALQHASEGRVESYRQLCATLSALHANVKTHAATLAAAGGGEGGRGDGPARAARWAAERDELRAQREGLEVEGERASMEMARVQAVRNVASTVRRWMAATAELKAAERAHRDAAREVSAALNMARVAGSDNLHQLLAQMREEKAASTARRAGIEGQIHQLELERRRIAVELSGDSLRTAEARLEEYTIAADVLDMAVKDLDKYFSALDAALMRYHNMKIQEVNNIVKELWTNTYHGDDIDGIEIRSDIEEETMAAAGAGGAGAMPTASSGVGGKRSTRSYNYRVVMTKSGTELDMRGRCSAGQKVLASIVIRLALAESFCISTGILALDEPTTNLDVENRRGLARALGKIIDLRRKTGNLQLIVITHDDEFVAELGRSMDNGGGSSSKTALGVYYRVFRERTATGGFRSRIVKEDYSVPAAIAT